MYQNSTYIPPVPAGMRHHFVARDPDQPAVNNLVVQRKASSLQVCLINCEMQSRLVLNGALKV
jgi:hypothetical protein